MSFTEKELENVILEKIQSQDYNYVSIPSIILFTLNEFIHIFCIGEIKKKMLKNHMYYYEL